MRDTFGLVPPHVKANVDREEIADRHLEIARELTKALKAEDRNLEIVWVSDRAPVEYGWIPGRWHVRRVNEGAPDSYMPITGPKGEYVEPHFGVLDQLRQRDLWKKDGVGSVDKLYERIEEEKRRKADQQHEEATEHLAERVDSAKRTSVSVPKGIVGGKF